MRVAVGEQFATPSFDTTGMFLQKHSESSATDVVIFTHGLGGSGASTWGKFPEFVFRSGDGYDVALFDYESFLRRFKSFNTSAMSFYREQLFHAISRLRTYEKVHIVGHSLGGLVNESVVRSIIEDGAFAGHGPLRQLASITNFASPRAGTVLAFPVINLLLPEFRMLRRYSKSQRDVAEYFRERITSDLQDHFDERRAWIPRFACYAGSDRFVGRYSATFAIPIAQRFPLTGTHGSIVKPSSSNDPQVTWLLENLAQVNSVRRRIGEEWSMTQQPPQQAVTRLPTMVTEFWGTDTGRWDAIYNEVRLEQSNHDFTIADTHDVPKGSRVDLLLAVSDAADVVAKTDRERRSVSAAAARAQEAHDLVVGLVPVGEEHSDARLVIIDWLPEDVSRSIRVNSASDGRELRLVLSEWIRNVARRSPSPDRFIFGDDSSDTVLDIARGRDLR